MLHQYWARLYLNPTESERALEPAVAKLGERYRSQHPFFGLKHIADFALLDRMRIIEVDGASHDTPLQKYKDLQHMIALKVLGWDVVRVTNDQAKADPEGTVSAALIQIPQTAQQLEDSLARLVRDYPELPEKAKPKRRGAGKRAAGRRKRRA